MKLVKLYADWCMPCKALEETLQRLNIEHESVDIESLDGEGLSAKYHVRAIPTLLKFDDEGNFIDKLTGNPDTEILKQFIHEIN